MFKYLVAFLLFFATAATAETKTLMTIRPTMPDFNPTEFVLIEDDEIRALVVRGSFNSSYSIYLASLLRTTKPDVLKIISLGGISIEGFSTGMVIKSHQEKYDLTVITGTPCVSACAYAVMGADNLRMDSFIAFHSPFISAMPMHTTLQQITELSRDNTVTLLKYTVKTGFAFELIDHVFQKTRPQKFLVFTDVEDFHRYKTNNPFTKVRSNDTLYELLTINQLRTRYGAN